MKKIAATIASIALVSPLFFAPAASASTTKHSEVVRCTSAQGNNVAGWHTIAAKPTAKKGYANTFSAFKGSSKGAVAVVGHGLGNLSTIPKKDVKKTIHVPLGQTIPITIYLMKDLFEGCTIETWARPHPSVSS